MCHNIQGTIDPVGNRKKGLPCIPASARNGAQKPLEEQYGTNNKPEEVAKDSSSLKLSIKHVTVKRHSAVSEGNKC